jgi:hypothetical protein
MPDTGRLLTTLRRATAAFRATPGRRGRLVQVADAEDVLVAGDLHGHLENFRRLLTRADLAHHPRRHLVLQELIHSEFHYPVGGDKSHQLLDLLAALKCQFPTQVHMLLGNHELAQWAGQWIAKGDSDLNELFSHGVQTAYGTRALEVEGAYQDLFAAMDLAVRTPNRVFLCHSLPGGSKLEAFDPGVLEQETLQARELEPGGAVHALVWGRDTRLETVAAFLQKVDADLLITGHIPSEKGFEVPNDQQIILDAMKTPAAYCLFPADRPLSQADLVQCVAFL